jgi:pimeloyl-ACP methyl ester carboxylesterase
MNKQTLLICSLALAGLTACGGTNQQEPEAYAIPAADSDALLQGLTDFEQHAESIRPRTNAGLFADAAVYGKAVAWALRHPEEFYSADYTQNAYKALEIAQQRLTSLEKGSTPWTHDKGYVVRAYRSHVDGSLQPYGLLIPESYNGKPTRLDVWLHGRGATLTEVSFIASHDPAFPHDGALSVARSQNYIQLDVFGRTNNAYRWAGETDVYEALADVRRNYNIDPERITLRGFSMGGAGAWHIGLHNPSQWAAVEAGAGFNETLIYAKLSDLPAYQTAALTIYDVYRYALNAFNVPTVGYGGEIDPQLQASVNVREQLQREGFAFTEEKYRWTTNDLKALFLIGPETPHRWHPDSKAESDAFINANLPRVVPDHVRFVTYTTAYPDAYWVHIEGLDKHYERAEIDAQRSPDGVTVKTTNIRAFSLTTSNRTYKIDGQAVSGAQANPYFVKSNGGWSVGKLEGRQKRPGLQGPIDDAFKGAFLVVRPTGTAIAPDAHAAAMKRMERFQSEYAKWMRGDVPVVDDAKLTQEQIATNNLVLFGDPGSNQVLARILDELPPLKWTADELKVAGQDYDVAADLPVLIYPNPLNPDRYVVINSGHTFGETEFLGTNALLFPRLGDWAVLSAADESTVAAGLFDEQWR